MMKPYPVTRRIPEEDASQALGAAIANLEYAAAHINTPKLRMIKRTCEALVLTIKLTQKVIERELLLIEDAQAQYAADAIPAKGEDDERRLR